MFSTATSPTTSLRRVHDDVGRSRAATSQPSDRASSHGSTPPASVPYTPCRAWGSGGFVAPRRQSASRIFGAAAAAESSVCSHPLSMTHPHPLSMAHSPGPMTGLGIRLPNNDATVSFFSSLRFHGKNSWMFSGTLSPAAAKCSKYHVSHFRDSASTATTWRSVFS